MREHGIEKMNILKQVYHSAQSVIVEVVRLPVMIESATIEYRVMLMF